MLDQDQQAKTKTRSVDWQRVYPEALRELEQTRQTQRRKKVNATSTDAPKIEPSAPSIGFALSGGGIRSATFCLGMFQALAKQQLIRRIDYLSTVSGGGYFGSFLGRLYARDYASPNAVETLLDPSLGTLKIEWQDKKPPVTINPVRWLRLNGRYMAPNGGGDLLSAAAIAIRNAVALHLVFASSLLLALLLLQLPVIAFERWTAIQPLLARLPGLGVWLQSKLSLLHPSPYFDLLPLMLALLVIPPGWAYWLIERRQPNAFHPFWGLLIALVTGVAGLLFGLFRPDMIDGNAPIFFTAVLTLLAIALLTVIAEWRASRCTDGERSTASDNLKQITPEALFQLASARSAVTASLARALRWTAVVAVIAMLDTLGLSLYEFSQKPGGSAFGWIAAVIAASAPIATRFGSLRSLLTSVGGSKSAWRLPINAMVTMVAVAAWATLLIALSWLAQAISHGFQPMTVGTAGDWLPTLIGLATLATFTLMFGHTWTFLNRSAHSALYAARLTRAYLGASNPERFEAGTPSSVTEPLIDDDSSIPAYTQGLLANGGPLHLINVTINETSSTDGKTVLRDRKGIGMAVGPFGLSAGAQHHAVHLQTVDAAAAKPEWIANLSPLRQTPEAYSMFASPCDPLAPIEPERMSLGQWIGISGAAFSTGLGSNTALGMSLLFAFANIRLGYWWDSGRKMKRKLDLNGLFNLLLPVQGHLVDEITASFRGPERRHWYLSDGGHFENMAAYELIRRRLPLIVIIDAEADPDYRFEGLANLVRKARMDFGATIEVLDDRGLDTLLNKSIRPLFGTLDELRPQAPDKFSKTRAVLAEVRYDDDPACRSLIIYIKPTMTAGDPTDVREYHARNDSFPQQTTADQFFDEAQWESYRKLGEVIGSQVFATVSIADDDPHFVPARLRPTSFAEIDAWAARQAAQQVTE